MKLVEPTSSALGMVIMYYVLEFWMKIVQDERNVQVVSG